MWPWEHVVVGYLAFTLFCHLYDRDSPNALEALIVAIASMVPDLIDKPLAWSVAFFDTGYAVGHSLFFAVPLSTLVGLLADSVGRKRAGIAFALGYLLHMPADILHQYASGNGVPYELMFWPVLRFDPGGHTRGLVGNFLHLFGHYLDHLLSGAVSVYMWGRIGITAFVFVVWLYDGAPVLRETVSGLGRLLKRARRSQPD